MSTHNLEVDFGISDEKTIIKGIGGPYSELSITSPKSLSLEQMAASFKDAIRI